jgi:nitrate reductase assembly molybdenum cofactor insertion protein NarJ
MTALYVSLPGDDYHRGLISCQVACPVHTDARGYVRAIAEGRFEDAYMIARGPNPFASICGRICGAPCEAACRRGHVPRIDDDGHFVANDRPVSIRVLKRFVCSLAGPESRRPDEVLRRANTGCVCSLGRIAGGNRFPQNAYRVDSIIEATTAMNAQLPVLDLKQKNLIEDASRWRLISMLFECPADGWGEMLTSLASVVSDPDLRKAVEAAQTEASEGLYHSVFGPGGPASPREVSHQSKVELGSLMSELTACYEAFGYQPTTREACDHVAVEAGFVGYLRLKETYAYACGDSEHAEITADAARHFIEDHLSAIAEPLAARLEQSGIRYLELACQALLRRAPAQRRP